MNNEKEQEKEYRTYQIRIKKGHKIYPYFDRLCLNGNNLYNTTNFYIRQVYTSLKQEKPLEKLQKEVMATIEHTLPKMNDNQLAAYQKKVNKEKLKPIQERKEIKCNLFDLPSKEKSFLGYNFLDCLFKTLKQSDYTSLPGQINQQIIRNVIQNWNSFFKALKDYQKHPEKYKAKPNIPSYLQKGGRKEVTLSNQICKVKDEKYLRFPDTSKKLNIGKLVEIKGRLQQVRVVPTYDFYTLEVIFLVGEKEEIEPKKDRCLSVDLGLDNLATLVTNTSIAPILIKGGKIKSINQWYNKMHAYYYAVLRNGKNQKEGAFHSKRLSKLHSKRQRQVKDFFHKVSFHIVKIAKEQNIDTIVIGKNQDWKQESNMGKRNNQNFVQIPHSLLIQMIQYKAQKEKIAVILTEESYTSKASFLDNDLIPTFEAGIQKKHVFSGKRIKRGLYKSKKGILLNADVNGACNILRKVVPNGFQSDGIAALCSTPHVVNVR